jgi:hypothetical protein
MSRAMPARRANNPALKGGTLSHVPAETQVIAFQYVGKSALTAIGPFSGRHYRFAHPGAIVPVDPRDAASLATVPNLHHVRGK